MAGALALTLGTVLLTPVARAGEPAAPGAATAYSPYSVGYQRWLDLSAGGQRFDVACPDGDRPAHLVVVVPDSGQPAEDALVFDGDFARHGFVVVAPTRVAPDVREAAASVDALVRAVLSTPPGTGWRTQTKAGRCAIAAGGVGVAGRGAGADVALAALRGADDLGPIGRVLLMPAHLPLRPAGDAAAEGDHTTLVIDAASNAHAEAVAPGSPAGATFAAVDVLTACDFRTATDPCHAPPPGVSPDLANGRNNASVHRQLLLESRAVDWMAFALEGRPSPFPAGQRVVDVRTSPPKDFMPTTVVRPLLTVDALVGSTWRTRDVPVGSGFTYLLRAESGASWRRKWPGEISPEQLGYSLGGYAEAGSSGDRDFLYGGGATFTTYAGSWGVTLSGGGYGRVASTNAAGVEGGLFVGLRNLGMPDFGDWEQETPIGVRVDGRLGVDDHPERSVSLLVEVAPLALVEVAVGMTAMTMYR